MHSVKQFAILLSARFTDFCLSVNLLLWHIVMQRHWQHISSSAAHHTRLYDAASFVKEQLWQ
jgi:hypothetical protein